MNVGAETIADHWQELLCSCSTTMASAQGKATMAARSHWQAPTTAEQCGAFFQTFTVQMIHKPKASKMRHVQLGTPAKSIWRFWISCK